MTLFIFELYTLWHHWKVNMFRLSLNIVGFLNLTATEKHNEGDEWSGNSRLNCIIWEKIKARFAQCNWTSYGALSGTISSAYFCPLLPQKSPSSQLFHWAPYWIESSRINFHWYLSSNIQRMKPQTHWKPAREIFDVCACAQLYMFDFSRDSSRWCHFAMFTWA